MNSLKGDVALPVGDVTYTLCLSANAIVELEEYLDQPVAQIGESLTDLAKLRMNTLRAVVWAGLREHHSEVDIKAAGALMDAAGVPVIVEAIGKAFEAAFPPRGSAAPQNPRKAKG